MFALHINPALWPLIGFFALYITIGTLILWSEHHQRRDQLMKVQASIVHRLETQKIPLSEDLAHWKARNPHYVAWYRDAIRGIE